MELAVLDLSLASVFMDKSDDNYARLENINILLMLAGFLSFIGIRQVKYKATAYFIGLIRNLTA